MRKMKDTAKIFTSKGQTQAVRPISERLMDSLYYVFIVLIPTAKKPLKM